MQTNGLPSGASDKEPAYNAGALDPEIGKNLMEQGMQSHQLVFLLEESRNRGA